MTIAKGVRKLVAYKKESAWGTLPGATGAKLLRRVTADFNLAKDTYTSNEITPSMQTIDMRHGIRRAEGSLSAELSPGSYSDFMASVLARDFTAGASATGLSVTIAATGALWTVTRATGSWLTDGFYTGNLMRLTGAGLNVSNVGNNLLIVSLTATVATVKVLSPLVPLVAEGPIASVTATVVGKQTYVPLSGHTDDSYTVEQFYADIAQSEVYTGLKVGTLSVDLPATGLVTSSLSFTGKNLEQTGTSQYFTSPTATNTNGIFAAVSGALIVNGVPVAVVTSMNINIERALEAANVVGTNFATDVFTGKINVTGNMSVYFQDATFRDYFDSEAKVSLIMALTTGSEKNADAVVFTMGKVKINSGTAQDAELGIVRSMDFQALQNDVTSGGLVASTIMVQDTAVA